MSEEKNTALSYSSATLLNNCEQRYAHYKVYETPKDPDYSDDYAAFDLGKTFHQVLEDTNHQRIDIDKKLEAACKEYNTSDNFLMLKAMLNKYLDLHEASGLLCVKCEFKLSTEEMIGFIDAVLKNNKDYWWICDLKTSGMWRETIVSRLAADPQLNLYSYFAKQMAPLLDLDPDKFMGCLYRVTTKSRLTQKGSDAAFYKRLYRSVKSYEIVIPVEEMQIEETWERHMEAYGRSMALRAGEVPRRNYSYCESFFRPCPYWSRCHGETNTKCKSKVKLNTAEILNNDRNIKEIL